MEWLPSRSVNLREEHRVFYHRIWAKDDSFWNQNQPGNLWNCKCDWQETDKPVTDGNPKGKKAKPGLEGNPAKTGEVFTDKASYIRRVKDKERVEKEAYSISRKESLSTAINKLKNKIVEKDAGDEKISIEFSRKGLEHLQHDYFPNKWVRNEFLQTIDTVLEKSEFAGKSENSKTNSMVECFYYYKAILFGKDWLLNIRKTKDGNIRLYSITEKVKRK